MKYLDRVFLNKNSSDGSYTSDMIKYAKERLYCVILSNTNILSDTYVTVEFFENISGRNRFNCVARDLEVVPKEEMKEAEERVQAYKRKHFAAETKLREQFLIPTQGNYQDKDFTKVLTQTIQNNVFVQQVTFKDDWSVSNVHKDLYLQGCCDFIKQTSSYIYYIPKGIMNFYEYTTWDISQWLNFIEGCEIDFKYKFEGEQSLPERMLGGWKNGQTGEHFWNNNGFCPLTAPCICIKVKSGAQPWHNYLYLVLMRYTHHYMYNRIPLIAMQIKDALEDQVTNFQALLMAHLYKYQNGCNGMCTPLQCIDIFQDPKVLLKNLESKAMNTSMQYLPKRNGTANAYDLKKCEEMIAKREFQQLLDYLKKAHNI